VQLIKGEKDEKQSQICIPFHPLELKISRTQFILHLDGETPGIQCISSESPTLLKLNKGKPIPLYSRMVIKIGDDQLIGVKSLKQQTEAEGTLKGRLHRHVEKEDGGTLKTKFKPKGVSDDSKEQKLEEIQKPRENEYVLELVYLDDFGNSRIKNKDDKGGTLESFSYKQAQKIIIGASPEGHIQFIPNKANDIKPLHCLIDFDSIKSQWFLYLLEENASVFVFIKDYDQFFENKFSNVMPLEQGDIIHIQDNSFLVE
jgi:hypothetical protein